MQKSDKQNLGIEDKKPLIFKWKFNKEEKSFFLNTGLYIYLAKLKGKPVDFVFRIGKIFEITTTHLGKKIFGRLYLTVFGKCDCHVYSAKDVIVAELIADDKLYELKREDFNSDTDYENAVSMVDKMYENFKKGKVTPQTQQLIFGKISRNERRKFLRSKV